ncbi:MAG TPA: outer membrane protein assembly factor BamD [Planctomycetota bacterium]|nr:outer membrane protein assembly factor BamD [Planctomycetota bacterium]
MPKVCAPLLALLAACSSLPKGEPAALLPEARVFTSKNDYEHARPYAEAIYKGYPESDEAEEALFLLAECRRHLRQGTRAFENYKKFVDKYPNSRFSVGVANGEYELGTAYLKGEMPGFLFFGADEAYGTRILDHMQIHFRNYSLADDALVACADYFMKDEDYEQASDALKRLLAEYPRSEHTLWARFQFARTLWLQNQGPMYDERVLIQSRRAYEDYVGTARLAGEAERQKEQIENAEQMIVRINERLAEKEYLIGRFYERTKASTSALYYYRHCVRTYPGTEFAGVCAKRAGELEAGATPQPVEPARPANG